MHQAIQQRMEMQKQWFTLAHMWAGYLIYIILLGLYWGHRRDTSVAY